ncbi:hypothetical protein DYB32_006153 [Aphanomyces invadans]|nr:hypothetical protein DYB32_006153 [Aphanomyces invadans]
MHRVLSTTVDSFGNDSTLQPPTMDARLPSLVRRLELALYLRAASLEEYLNEKSLQRRVQHLIVSLHHQSVLHFSAQEVTFRMPSLKRRAATASAEETSVEVSAKKPRKSTDPPLHPECVLFLGNQEHVLGHVFSFLDGIDVVRCMSLNRFAASFLPRNVRYLSLSWHQLAAVLGQQRLQRFQQLERLAVAPPLPLFHPTSTPPTLSNELVVVQLAAALPSRALKQLILSNVYIHTDDVNATSALCSALLSCTSLTHLSLAGNAIGDSGMAAVTAMLPSLPALVHLDLRRNYIGESGMHAFARMLQTGSHPLRLHTLLLGSNIAARSVCNVAAGVGHRRLQHLRVLGLEDNFVDLAGVEALAQVLRQGVCPVLQELCIGDNAVDNRVIRSVFAFAKPAML